MQQDAPHKHNKYVYFLSSHLNSVAHETHYTRVSSLHYARISYLYNIHRAEVVPRHCQCCYYAYRTLRSVWPVSNEPSPMAKTSS
jgi:hypothetical protein